MANAENNRAYTQMLSAALERLGGRAARDISEKTGIFFDEGGSEFRFYSMGREIRLSYPDFSAKCDIDSWLHLVILHYMDIADGTPLSPGLMSFSELKDGMVRGGGFDRRCEAEVSGFFALVPKSRLRKACLSLGAELISSNADICAVFPFLPRYPVTLKIWFPEDDLPGSGKMFLNASADRFLTIEDAVTVGDIVLEALKGALKSLASF